MSRYPSKPLRNLYWVVTPTVLFLHTWIALQGLSDAPRVVDAVSAFGYPLYLVKILAVANLLGVAAVLTGISPTLKEWAYAGFTFEVCGAFASHLSAGDSVRTPVLLALVLGLQLASYFAWRTAQAERSARRRRRNLARSHGLRVDARSLAGFES